MCTLARFLCVTQACSLECVHTCTALVRHSGLLSGVWWLGLVRDRLFVQFAPLRTAQIVPECVPRKLDCTSSISSPKFPRGDNLAKTYQRVRLHEGGYRPQEHVQHLTPREERTEAHLFSSWATHDHWLFFATASVRANASLRRCSKFRHCLQCLLPRLFQNVGCEKHRNAPASEMGDEGARKSRRAWFLFFCKHLVLSTHKHTNVLCINRTSLPLLLLRCSETASFCTSKSGE